MDTNGDLSFSSCPVCFEEYKDPKILPCGHTFCLQCLQSIVKLSDDPSCPKCKKEFPTPTSGNMADFTTNYDLLTAMEETGQTNEVSASEEDDDHREEEETPAGGSQVAHNAHCMLHDLPYEFFCKSCSKQTCKDCLRGKHNPSIHKIMTTEAYVQEQSQDVQKISKELDSLLSMQQDLGKQLADADSKCQGEAKQLRDEIMANLEKKVTMLREEAEKMVKDISEELKRKQGMLKQLRKKQNSLITDTEEEKQSIDSVKTAIEKNVVTDPVKLTEIQNTTSQISKQANSLKASSEAAGSSLHLKFQKQHHQIPYLGDLVSKSTSPPMYGRLLWITKSPRRIILAVLVALLSIYLIKGSYCTS
ncbi:tripartite motif-containing protein 2-like [Apostichopus japonicus]|uniref:tripartite motif-containing protein 2-like n=1 Tax=Stichopus japonicus TaxID=307972 RepID=UPI003AB6C351